MPHPMIGAGEGRAEAIIQSILRIHKALSVLPDLRPCEYVNRLFGELVAHCTKPLSQETIRQILSSSQIRKIIHELRMWCSEAEYLLESFWADYICMAENSEEASLRLSKFSYYENYVDLTRMELSSICAVNGSFPRRIGFIGSGPLPLTSICLYRTLSKQNMEREDAQNQDNDSMPVSSRTTKMNQDLAKPLFILNIDHDAQAIAESRVLCDRLGYTSRTGMSFVLGSTKRLATVRHDLQSCDVVYLAALVGVTQEIKEKIVVEVVRNMSPGSLLVVRTAHSLRTILYPELDAMTDTIQKHLEICMVVHPYNQVVNSIIIGRVKAKEAGAENSDSCLS